MKSANNTLISNYIPKGKTPTANSQHKFFFRIFRAPLQLTQTVLHRQIPRAPQGVGVGTRERWDAHGGTTQRAHDAVGQQKVAEERGDQMFLAKKALEFV